MATSSPPTEFLSIDDIRRGRNSGDEPEHISDNECVDAVDVDFYKSRLGRKRGGADSLSMTGSTMTGVVSSLGRHIPTSDSSLAELWATDDSATPKINRLAGGATWTAPTLKDAPTGNGWDFDYASSGGKLFIAYKSAVNRLHCWDPLFNQVRRTGILIPLDAPTAANTTPGGTYAAVLRYYRVRWVRTVAGFTDPNLVVHPETVFLRSEPSASVAFTPSGANTGVVITQPSLLTSDGTQSHWEVEVSLDNVTFYRIATVIITTPTYTDSALTTTYGSNPVSASIGLYTTQPSYKFIAVDQNRLLGFGSYTSTDKQNRIEISDVIGGLNVSDNERVPLGSYLDLDENDSGAPTGLIGPMSGSYFAFKETQIWKLTPSGNVTVPYTQTCLSKTIGAVGPHAIARGEDEYGNACIYWVYQRGIYRYGMNGIENIGGGVSDLIIGPTSTINLAASKVIAHVQYYALLRQVWVWISVGSENEPQSTKLVYNLGHYGGFIASTSTQTPSGWTRHTGESAKARASVLFSNTVGSAMSQDRKPYIGYSGANTKIWKLDTATLTDAGTPYKAYVVTKCYSPWTLAKRGFVNRSYLVAKSSAGATITQTLTGDFGIQTSADTVNLTPGGTETRVRRRFEDSRIADISYLQITWGDAAAAANSWQLDAAAIEYSAREIA